MYTRTGDKGETSLFGARRVSKDSERVETYGEIDELNSALGVAISVSKDQEITAALKDLQKLMFVAGSDLAADLPEEGVVDRIPRISKSDTERIEKSIDDLHRKLPKLTNFILPGGGLLASHIQLCRGISRRVERRLIAANRVEVINQELMPFMNRLSTYLFNLARYANMKEGIEEETWKGL